MKTLPVALNSSSRDGRAQVVGILCVIIATVASSLKPVFAAVAMKGVDKPSLECAVDASSSLRPLLLLCR